MMMAEYEGSRVQQKHHGSRILHIGNVVRATCVKRQRYV